jgi:hypothetical protein
MAKIVQKIDSFFIIDHQEGHAEMNSAIAKQKMV